MEQIARLTNVEVQLNEEKSILVITGSSECIVKARQEIKELLVCFNSLKLCDANLKSYETKTLKYLGDIKSIIPIVSESCRVQVRDGKKKQYTFIGERTSDLTQAQRTIESLIALSERPVSPLILTSEHASSGPVFNIYPVADTLDAPAWRHIPMFRPRLGANLPRLPDSPTSNYLSHGASLTLGSLSDAINQLKPSTGGRLRLGHLAFYPSITHGTSFKGLPLAGKSLQLKDVALWMHESGPKARLMPSIMRNYQNSLLEDAKVESRKDQVELVLRKGVAEEIESAENFLHVTLDVTSNGFELVSAQTTGSRRAVNFIDLDDGLDMQWRDAPKIDDKLVAAIKQLMNYVNSEGLDNLGTICMNGENYGRVFIKNKSVTSFNTRNELYRLQIIQSTVDGILSATEQPVLTAIEVEPLGDNLAAVVAHVRRSMKR